MMCVRSKIRSGPAAVAMAMCASVACGAQAANGSGSISGVVHAADGHAAAGATVQLVGPSRIETKTEPDGRFVFRSVANGSYIVQVSQTGGGSASAKTVTSDAAPNQKIELTLANNAAAAAIDFADNPNFTVAGVTDWTAVGGHGSDATLRTSEDLARETAALKVQTTESGRAASPGLEHALALRDAGDYAAAREQARLLLMHSDDAAVHRLLGDLEDRLGDPLDAVKQDERAAQLDPSEENYFAWGSELLLHRAVWQAGEVFRSGAAAHPRSARMLTGLGTALFASALYDEAAQRLCAASDLEPNDPQPYLFMGKAMLAAPSPLPCVGPKLARFVKLHPEDSQANYLYAMALTKGEEAAKPGEVEVLLTKAVALDGKCSDGYLELGILASAKKDNAGAVADFERAIAANPQSGEAHYRLAVAYDRMGEAVKAKQEFARHEAIEKQQADAVEAQRREVKQFLVVLQEKPAPSKMP